MIEKGDMIGDMVITTIDIFGNTHLGMFCDLDNASEIAPNTMEMECEAVKGDLVLLDCLGLRGDSTEELDSNWGKNSWEMTIDDQIIDLPSFGTLDVDGDQDYPKIRFWNVAIENIAAGTHTVICEILEGEQQVLRIIFTVPEQAKTYPTLPPTAISGQHEYTSEIAQLDL
jgi:hypothetical protein